MKRKTYYMVLGVSDIESPSGIRAAYRDLAKKVHPDLAGEQSAGVFREVTEAYHVLSNPERRREYDHQLRRPDPLEAVSSLHSMARPSARRPVTILGQPESIEPSFEAMFDRFFRNFSGVGVPKSERLEGLNFEVLLTPAEIAHGCVVPVQVPVFRPCPQCDGTGYSWAFPCTYCQRQGLIETEQIVRIRVPPMVPSGTVFELPLQGLGIHNLYLRLHVFRAGGTP